jgi:hypothetical protein
MNYALFPIMCVQVPTTWWWEGKTISPASADWWPVRLTKLVESLPQSAGVGSTLQSVTLLSQRGKPEHGQWLFRPLGQRRSQPDCARFVQLGGWPPLRRAVRRGTQWVDTRNRGHPRKEGRSMNRPLTAFLPSPSSQARGSTCKVRLRFSLS